jgi:hypothetical protein
MTLYLGTKLVDALPMNRWEYNDYRGWTVPDDEDGSDGGYLVEYLDGGKKNHPNHKGYISWSPKDVFQNAYKVSGELPFGQAIELIKEGKKVSRAGWNGKDMFLFLVPGSTFKVNRPPLLGIYPEGTEINYCSHIDMKTADGSVVPWLASQTDVLSEDWGVVE